MSLRILVPIAACVTIFGSLHAFQKPFREYPGVEYQLGTIPLPADYEEKSEWTFARLMYPPIAGRRNGYGAGFGGGFGFRSGGGLWSEGNSIWTQDYPRADRHFSQAVRRLTRIQVRSVEQPVNLDDGEVYDWPWLYAVQAGQWNLTDAQAKTLREFLLRGGFFMADDFWGEDQWDSFMASMRKVSSGARGGGTGESRTHFPYGLRSGRPLPGGQRRLRAARAKLEMRALPRPLARHLR